MRGNSCINAILQHKFKINRLRLSEMLAACREAGFEVRLLDAVRWDQSVPFALSSNNSEERRRQTERKKYCRREKIWEETNCEQW